MIGATGYAFTVTRAGASVFEQLTTSQLLMVAGFAEEQVEAGGLASALAAGSP